MPTKKCSGDDRSFYEPDTGTQLTILSPFLRGDRAFLAGLGERPVASRSERPSSAEACDMARCRPLVGSFGCRAVVLAEGRHRGFDSHVRKGVGATSRGSIPRTAFSLD